MVLWNIVLGVIRGPSRIAPCSMNVECVVPCVRGGSVVHTRLWLIRCAICAIWAADDRWRFVHKYSAFGDCNELPIDRVPQIWTQANCLASEFSILPLKTTIHIDCPVSLLSFRATTLQHAAIISLGQHERADRRLSPPRLPLPRWKGTFWRWVPQKGMARLNSGSCDRVSCE